MSTDSNSRLYLAVDAGGTKADFLLATDTAELARVRVDSIKILTTRPELAEASFREALARLEQASGVSPARITRACIGASGLSVPAVAAWIREQHANYVGGELLLCGDEEIAFDAAFEDGRGVLALAGTGSNVLGRTSEGEWVRAGGWGPVLGDEGSGHWIGLEAVRAIFRAIDQGDTTTLESKVLECWGLRSRAELIQLGNTAGSPRFAELAQVVVACALAGDKIASGILDSAGEALAHLVATVIRKMAALEGQSEPPEVAVAGSILANVARVRDAMAARLRNSWPAMVVRPGSTDAVLGALRRVRQKS